MTDWTRVQGIATSTATTAGQSFGSTVGVGNIVVGDLLLSVGSGGGQTVYATVTDDQSNPYLVQVCGYDGGGAAPGLTICKYRSKHLLTNHPQKIIATPNGTTTVFWQGQEEFAPPTGTTDISLAGSQYMVNDTGATLPNMQVLKSDCLLHVTSLSTAASTVGTGFNAGINAVGGQFVTEWAIQAAANNAVSTFFASQTGTTWAASMAIAPVSQFTWEPIQTVINRTGTGTTASASFINPVGSGNIIVGSIASDASQLANLSSLKDDKNNSYLPLITGTYNTGQGPTLGDRQSFWSNGQLFNGPKQITATYGSSQSVNFLQFTEFSPPPGTVIVQIDGTPVNTNNSTSSTSTTSPNVTTVFSGDLAYGWGDNAGSLDKPGNSFSALNGESQTWMTSYYITGSPGSYNFVCNHGTGTLGNDVSLVIFDASSNVILMGQILI